MQNASKRHVQLFGGHHMSHGWHMIEKCISCPKGTAGTALPALPLPFKAAGLSWKGHSQGLQELGAEN